MVAEQALVTSNVDPEISAALQVYDRLAPLRNALGIADLTNDELQLFAMVAHRTGLDPFTRQIYAVKRKGKVVHQTGIDGYRSIAESKGGGQYAGSDEATYEACDCGKAPEGHPKIARVVVHRILPSGHVVDQTGIARWHELYPGDGSDGFMWRQMPWNQLAKCAEANALRKAFPRVLAGVYITEEMEQAGEPENGLVIEAAAQPTARERIAQRRAAIEQTAQPTADESTDDDAEWIDEKVGINQGVVTDPVSDPIAPAGEMTAAEFRTLAAAKFIGTSDARRAAAQLFVGRAFGPDYERWGLSGAEWHALAVELGLVE